MSIKLTEEKHLNVILNFFFYNLVKGFEFAPSNRIDVILPLDYICSHYNFEILNEQIIQGNISVQRETLYNLSL